MRKKDPNTVGILGGTFDPVHIAHLMIAEHAASELHLEEVWLMPTGKSPHKDESAITPAAHRTNMIELAVEDNPRLSLSRFELDDPGISYTYRTAERLAVAYPGTRFFYIMGADSLEYFRHWKHPEIICKTFTLVAAVRDAADTKDLERLAGEYDRMFGARVHILSVPNFSISSTNIRNRLQNGQSVRYLLPDSVLSYIYGNALYGSTREENGSGGTKE